MNLKNKALRLGASDFGNSTVKNKRFYVIYNGKKINFGSSVGNTFIDHKDPAKRRAWKARHSKIKLKTGALAYLNKQQPSYWAYNLLW
jgi:hypothetical protein